MGGLPKRPLRRGEALLDKGAVVDQATTDNSATPLYVACHNGHFDAAKLLLTMGAAIDQVADNGTTPLFMACQNGHFEVVKLLLANRADPSWSVPDNTSVLGIAARGGHTSICRRLLRYGARPDVDIRSPDGAHDWSPLALAQVAGHADTVALFERRLMPCSHCGKSVQDRGVLQKRMMCSLCRAVGYCSEECQRAAWEGGGHEQACEALGAERRGFAARLTEKRRQEKQHSPPQAAAASSASAASPGMSKDADEE